MASSTGNSSGSDHGATYSSLADGLMDQRKRKRMESNRESARRSRMRKQKYIDDLMAESTLIKKDTNKIRTTITTTTQRFIVIEAENSVLRAQVSELQQRLDSLTGMLNSINISGNCTTHQCINSTSGVLDLDFMENPWNMMFVNQQPMMASMFGY